MNEHRGRTEGHALGILILAALVAAFGVIGLSRGESLTAGQRFLAGALGGPVYLAALATFLVDGQISRVIDGLIPGHSGRSSQRTLALLLGLAVGAAGFLAVLIIFGGIQVFGARLVR